MIQPLTGEQAKKRDMGRGHPHIAYRGNNNDIVCAVGKDTLSQCTLSHLFSSFSALGGGGSLCLPSVFSVLFS